MRNMDLKMVVVILLLAFSFHGEGSSGLSFNFYDESCPQLEDMVRAGVRSLFLADPTTPAALLRLMFHDCQVQRFALSGGPGISVPLGRKDSSNPPDFRLADTLIPPADIGADGVLQLFSEKGMTVEETAPFRTRLHDMFTLVLDSQTL
ncbi:UNVERIFIED_CONTAM: Peroxidase 29 [Sesamum calycinum]|uniref:peroxidase n=1 Tax=Sesamum calycinum TaxID=2727403 RepID=A0AAW2R8T7_9LAMI